MRSNFDAWARKNDLPLERIASGRRYCSMETEWAHRAWLASMFNEASDMSLIGFCEAEALRRAAEEMPGVSPEAYQWLQDEADRLEGEARKEADAQWAM